MVNNNAKEIAKLIKTVKPDKSNWREEKKKLLKFFKALHITSGFLEGTSAQQKTYSVHMQRNTTQDVYNAMKEILTPSAFIDLTEPASNTGTVKDTPIASSSSSSKDSVKVESKDSPESGTKLSTTPPLHSGATAPSEADLIWAFMVLNETVGEINNLTSLLNDIDEDTEAANLVCAWRLVINDMEHNSQAKRAQLVTMFWHILFPHEGDVLVCYTTFCTEMRTAAKIANEFHGFMKITDDDCVTRLVTACTSSRELRAIFGNTVGSIHRAPSHIKTWTKVYDDLLLDAQADSDSSLSAAGLNTWMTTKTPDQTQHCRNWISKGKCMWEENNPGRTCRFKHDPTKKKSQARTSRNRGKCKHCSKKHPYSAEECNSRKKKAVASNDSDLAATIATACSAATTTAIEALFTRMSASGSRRLAAPAPAEESKTASMPFHWE
jgi:hypothetical protein